MTNGLVFLAFSFFSGFESVQPPLVLSSVAVTVVVTFLPRNRPFVILPTIEVLTPFVVLVPVIVDVFFVFQMIVVVMLIDCVPAPNDLHVPGLAWVVPFDVPPVTPPPLHPLSGSENVIV